MKKLSFSILVSIVFVFATHTLKAQITAHNQNFDGVIGALPTGWVASPASGGWLADTAAANVSSGYTNASGLQNVVIKNATGISGDFELTSAPISTLGFHNIAVIWGARNTTHFSDSGSTISSFQWSIDGGNTWSPLTYVQNVNNSVWSLVNNATPIALSSAADNRSAVLFKWTASLQGNPSGTYRIDDFQVTGTTVTGVEQVLHSNADLWIFNASAYNQQLHVETSSISGTALQLFDLTGRCVASFVPKQHAENYSLEFLPSGIYMLAASNGNERRVKRICLTK